RLSESERPNRNASPHASRKPRAGARFNPDVQGKSLANDGLSARGIPKSRSLRSCINRGIDTESKKSAVIVGPSYEPNCDRPTLEQLDRMLASLEACHIGLEHGGSFASRMLPFYWDAEHSRMRRTGAVCVGTLRVGPSTPRTFQR